MGRVGERAEGCCLGDEARLAILTVARLCVVLPELDLERGGRRLGSLKVVVKS